MMAGTSKIMSLVRESWRASPLTQLRIRRSATSSSSADTSTGPSGANPGAHLPFDHWPPECAIWWSRSDRSLPST